MINWEEVEENGDYREDAERNSYKKTSKVAEGKLRMGLM